jgi:hypothetical protein
LAGSGIVIDMSVIAFDFGHATSPWVHEVSADTS